MKWKLIGILILFTLSGSILINSCKKISESEAPTPLAFVYQENFPAPVYNFEGNPLTQEGFELGRKLFYDGQLSIDGNYPCVSCHHQIAVFGTYDQDRSHGYNDQHTLRNASPLFNLAWKKEFHADGEFTSLESEFIQPITAHNEMAETIDHVLKKLRRDTSYNHYFQKAFGSHTVTLPRIQKALSQFVLLLVSGNTKFDKYKKGQAAFTDYEQRGYEIYQAKCATCHPEPMFTDYSYRNIGLPKLSYIPEDNGRMMVTGKREDSLKFRVPSLRNVSLTYPYMHDGRFHSLKACLEHYRDGIQQNPNLDPLLANGIQLNDSQIIDVVAFLRTLTDSTLVTDTKFVHQH
ncbi:MAG: c-type cytochrome [Chitinophagaceae bacterium]|nr:MAG: c-type cytochrome [Chitinophagaceae bacterium]